MIRFDIMAYFTFAYRKEFYNCIRQETIKSPSIKEFSMNGNYNLQDEKEEFLGGERN